MRLLCSECFTVTEPMYRRPQIRMGGKIVANPFTATSDWRWCPDCRRPTDDLVKSAKLAKAERARLLHHRIRPAKDPTIAAAIEQSLEAEAC